MNEHIADPFRAIVNAFAHPTGTVAAILNPVAYPPAPVCCGDVVEIECAVCLGDGHDDEGNRCVACAGFGRIVTERGGS